MYVSNENNQDVTAYFDDIQVRHKQTSVAVATDYYPFGMPMDSREIKRKNWRCGYQGEYAEKDEKSGWNQFQLRMYDPIIGRWLSVDPMRQYSNGYVGMGNNPVRYTDPDGGCVDDQGNSIPCPDGIPESGNENLKILNEVIVEGSRNLFHHVEKQFYNGYVPGGSKQMQTYSYTSGTRVNFWLESHVMVNAQYNLNLGGDNLGEVTENNLVNVWVMSSGDVKSRTEVSLNVNGEITTVQLQVDPDVPVIHAHENYHGKAVFVVPNKVRSFSVKVNNPIWVENAKGRWVPTATSLGLVPISPSTGWMPIKFD